MLKFKGIKEFDIEKIDNKLELSRNFQIIFLEDALDEEETEIVENSLKSNNFNIKNEKIEINVIYNIDLNITTITMVIYCPLMHSNQILEEKLLDFVNEHKINFEDYYKQIKPY